MKKKLMYLVFAACCTMGVFTSCSDDDDVVCPIENTTYTVENGLELTYNGEALLGKKVTFTPTNNGKANITLEGDLSFIEAMSRSNLKLPTGAGVFPGEVTTTFAVDLNVKGDEVSFSGSTESQNCTFDYEGSANSGNLKLALKNVKLKNGGILAGTTWILNTDEAEEAPTRPIHIKWEAEKGLELFPRFSMPMQSILQLAVVLPLIPNESATTEEEENVSVVDMLKSVLQDVTFEEDGNITATYRDAVKGGTHWTSSPKNLAQYCIESDSQMRVFLNVDGIIAASRSRADEITNPALAEAVSVLSQQAYQLLVYGVPVEYHKEGNDMTVYLNTQLLLPILKIGGALLTDESIQKTIMDAIANDPDMAEMAPTIQAALQSLPEIINSTTAIEIGLELKAK